jgi:hypothetical protein
MRFFSEPSAASDSENNNELLFSYPPAIRHSPFESTYRSSSSSTTMGLMKPVRRGGGMIEPRPRTASQMI